MFYIHSSAAKSYDRVINKRLESIKIYHIKIKFYGGSGMDKWIKDKNRYKLSGT